MAKMFPEKLPREVLEDPKRSSEVSVYNALNEQLDDKYHVFYSSPWLGTYPDGSEVDGEADFLVAHPDKGILTIEVKGGRVELDSNDQWTSTDRHGFKRNIKNPINQARTSKYNLLKQLKQSHHWESRFICARHGVILPHVVKPSRDLRPDMPLKLFAFDADMNNLQAWIESRLGNFENGDERIKALGEAGLYALDDMLARPIKLRVRLGTNVNQDLKEIKLKTDDQIFILREMEENHRMAIAGAAGTGKTILAIEKAVMLAESGLDVLLLCFNRPLGEFLKQSLTDYPSVTANNFHQYCLQVARTAGNSFSKIDPLQLGEELVSNFVEAGMKEYDAVIIDEGQDFRDYWLTALEVVVKGGDSGVLYVFYDDNQKVMNTSASYIKRLPLAKYRLTRNFRNTKQIFRSAEDYYLGDFVRAIGPEGTKPTLHTVKNEATLKVMLSERIGSLIKTEGIAPGDIAILFPDEDSVRCLDDERERPGQNNRKVGLYRATDAIKRNPDQIIIDTIRRFKGLESPVVLLILNVDAKDKSELLYTGITRAQALLDVFGPRHVIRQLEGNNI